MRTKEAIDRETREFQERQWIYMLHQQNPPLTRQATPPVAEAPSGLIPLAPLANHAASPLVAARAAAASMALHVNEASNANANGTWALPPPHLSRTSSDVRPSDQVYGSMVKLDNTKLPSAHQLLGQFPFRSILSKSSMPDVPATPSSSTNSSAFVELLPKRRREEVEDPRHVAESDDGCDETTTTSCGKSSSKRTCLPKKCDFPMCQNSARSRGFCYSHGGGRRCRMEGCANGAVSRDLCKRHGGGRRCRIAGCKSSSESGGLCYSHGGGRRCRLSWCNARAKKGGYCGTHLDNKDAPCPEEPVTPATPAAATQTTDIKVETSSVNPFVVETLLALSKSPSNSEDEDSDSGSPTSPASAFMSPRLAHPYAIASILN